MRFVIQEVDSCVVKDDENNFVSKIDNGFVIYFGAEQSDLEECDAKSENFLEILSKKAYEFISTTTNNSKSIMLLSQFTLMATFVKSKPSFHKAGDPEKSKEIFYKVKEMLCAESGIFRTKLQIEVKGSNLHPQFYKI